LPAGLYYGYVLIAAAFVAQFVSIGILSYVAGAFMAPMSDELGWSRAEFTIARSLGQLVLGFAGFFIGTQVDRIGGRRLMLVGAFVLAISLMLHAGIGALWQWVVLNGVVTTIGCALIGNNTGHVQRSLQGITNWVESDWRDVSVVDDTIELI